MAFNTHENDSDMLLDMNRTVDTLFDIIEQDDMISNTHETDEERLSMNKINDITLGMNKLKCMASDPHANDEFLDMKKLTAADLDMSDRQTSPEPRSLKSMAVKAYSKSPAITKDNVDSPSGSSVTSNAKKSMLKKQSDSHSKPLDVFESTKIQTYKTSFNSNSIQRPRQESNVDPISISPNVLQLAKDQKHCAGSKSANSMDMKQCSPFTQSPNGNNQFQNKQIESSTVDSNDGYCDAAPHTRQSPPSPLSFHAGKESCDNESDDIDACNNQITSWVVSSQNLDIPPQQQREKSPNVTKKQFSSVEGLLEDGRNLMETLTQIYPVDDQISNDTDDVSETAPPSKPSSPVRKPHRLQRIRSFLRQSIQTLVESSSSSSDDDEKRKDERRRTKSLKKSKSKKTKTKLSKSLPKRRRGSNILDNLFSCASNRRKLDRTISTCSTDDESIKEAAKKPVRRSMMLVKVPLAKGRYLDYDRDKQARDKQFEDFCQQHPNFCEPSQTFHYSVHSHMELKESLYQFICHEACRSIMGVIVINGHGNKHGLCMNDGEPLPLDDIISYISDLQEERHRRGCLPHVVRIVFAQCHGHQYTEPIKHDVEVVCLSSPQAKKTNSFIKLDGLTKTVVSSSHHELRTYASRVSLIEEVRLTIKVDVRLKRRTLSEANMETEEIGQSFVNLVQHQTKKQNITF